MARLGHFRLNIVCQTDNVNILKALVAENIGISLQTAISINPDDHLHAIDIEAEDFPTFNMSIAYHARHYLTDKHKKYLIFYENQFNPCLIEFLLGDQDNCFGNRIPPTRLFPCNPPATSPAAIILK